MSSKKNIFNLSYKSSAISKRKSRLRELYFSSRRNLNLQSSDNNVDLEENSLEQNPPILEPNNIPGSSTQDFTLNTISENLEIQSSSYSNIPIIDVSSQSPPFPLSSLISNDSSESEDDETLEDQLAEWAVINNINRTAVTELLHILGRRVGQRMPQLPAGYQALLSTPRNLQVLS